jgi:hypothetical protein
MMRLIDADALKKLILEERDKIPFTVPAAPYEFVKEKANIHGNAERGGIRKALRCMEQTPTIEAEPVVHCKDCKYSKKFYITGNRYCDFHGAYEYPVSDDDYCSNGAKMDLEG